MEFQDKLFTVLVESSPISIPKQDKAKVKYSKLTPITPDTSTYDYAAVRGSIVKTGDSTRYNLEVIGSGSKELFHCYHYEPEDKKHLKEKLQHLKKLKAAISEFISACEKDV